MFDLPIFERLSSCKNILIAGAGGGFDVFSGLPLYFGLKKQGKNVHLANFTFSDVATGSGAPARLGEHLVAVNADSTGAYYFPEKYLCQWLRQKGDTTNIYCFERSGTQQLKRSYELLLKKLSIDCVILVDGGTDSLLRGDEEDLGTPEEDMASLAAVDQLDVPTKILACLGFGIDSHHGVCHAHVLDTIAGQIKKNGYLGAISLMNSMPEVKQFQGAASYVHRCMPECPSIVVSSIQSALNGEFGNHHDNERTQGSELFINPLMSIYWFFDLSTLASSILYIDKLRAARDLAEVHHAIRKALPKDGKRKWRAIPF